MRIIQRLGPLVEVSILGISLLSDAHHVPSFLRPGYYALQEVAYHRVRRSGDADRPPLPDQVHDGFRSNEGFAGTGWALNREVRGSKLEYHAPGGVACVLTLTTQRRSFGRPRTGTSSEHERASGSDLIEARPHHLIGQLPDPLREFVGVNRTRLNDGCRERRVSFADLEINRSVVLVDADDYPGLLRHWVFGAVSSVEPVLLGRESEASHNRALLLANLLTTNEAAYGVRLVNQLGA